MPSTSLMKIMSSIAIMMARRSCVRHGCQFRQGRVLARIPSLPRADGDGVHHLLLLRPLSTWHFSFHHLPDLYIYRSMPYTRYIGSRPSKAIGLVLLSLAGDSLLPELMTLHPGRLVVKCCMSFWNKLSFSVPSWSVRSGGGRYR